MRHERAILKQTCKELAKLAGRALARAMQADALGNVEMAKKEHDLSTRLETALRTYQTALDSVRVGEGAPVQPMPSMQGQATPTTQPSAVQPKTALDSVRVGEGAPVQPMQPMPSMQGQATPTTQPSTVQLKTAVVASAPSYTMNDILDALRDQLPATDKRPEAQQVCLAALNALQHLSSPPAFCCRNVYRRKFRLER